MSPGAHRRKPAEPTAWEAAEMRKLLDDVAAGRATADEAVTRWKEEIYDAPATKKNAHPLIGVFAGLLFAVFGGVFAYAGLLLGWHSLQFSLGTEEAVGTVIELQETKSRKGGASWHPVIRYVVDDKEFTLSNTGGTGWRPYAIGDSVTVLYRPESPQVAQLKTFTERWLFAIFSSLVGTLFACLGVAIAVASWREWRRKEPAVVIMATP